MVDGVGMKVGFVGIGSQGGPMARRIVESGFPLSIWARRPEAAQFLVDAGATLMPDVAALGRCDLVGICVFDDAGVTAVADALVPEMNGGTIVIFSTIDPETCRRIATDAAARHIAVIDAPVSGGGAAAAARTLTVMAGGDATAINHARPVIETFAGLFLHLGPLGAGLMAKLVNNSLMAANLALGDAAREIAASLGVDLAALDKLIPASSGRSYAYEMRARLPTLAAFAGGEALLRKDICLLDKVAGANGVDAGTLTQTANSFLDKVVISVRA